MLYNGYVTGNDEEGWYFVPTRFNGFTMFYGEADGAYDTEGDCRDALRMHNITEEAMNER